MRKKKIAVLNDQMMVGRRYRVYLLLGESVACLVRIVHLRKEAFCLMAGRDHFQMEPHILFVDDNSDICELVEAMLQAAGFHVSTADSAPRALQLIARERFDVLVLDNCMPDSTGIELCCRIRVFDKTTPILICSGAVAERDKKEALLAGAQGYVNKPFSSNDLIQALRSFKSAR